MQLHHESQKHNLQIQAPLLRLYVNLPRSRIIAKRFRHVRHRPAVDNAVWVEGLREEDGRALKVLFGAYAPGAVDFAGGHVVHLQLAEEVRDRLARVGPHTGVEAEFERVFDFV